jgi:hypothetical protein
LTRTRAAPIWDAATGQQQFPVIHGAGVVRVALSPRGTRTATRGGNTTRIRDAALRPDHGVCPHGRMIVQTG